MKGLMFVAVLIFNLNLLLLLLCHAEEAVLHPFDPLPCFKKYEKFNICASHCPRTCDNLHTKIYCILSCVAKCDCIPGYVRDSNGDCIDPAYCPTIHKCPVNQELACLPCVENTCENSYYNGIPPFLCKKPCILGCVCKKGYTRRSSTKKCCIPIEKCPVCCAVNREFKECGPIKPKSCDNPEEVQCHKQCNRGCFCKDGLVEDGNGNCIPPERCPSNCGANELEDTCVNPCQPTCAMPNRPVCKFLVCNKGCVCRPPYLRDDHTNQCVSKADCS